MKSARQTSGERGASLILFTFLTFLVVIPLVGLAIDGGVVFWEKAKLSASADGAALAAGRSLSAAQNCASSNAIAQDIAAKYFQANFQPGTMGTTMASGSPSIPPLTCSQSGTRIITVDATAIVPLFFLPLFGFRTTTISAHGQTARRDVNVMLVLDRSSSMNITGPDGKNVCQTMKSSAQTFVNYFSDGRDQLGLVTFHAGVNLDYKPTKTFKSGSPSLSSVIGNLVCGSNTSSADALNLAYQTLSSPQYALPGALNVIVFFTDGQPNGIYGDFPKLVAQPTSPETRYDVAPNYNNTVTATTSGCTPTNLSGVIAQWAGGAVKTGDTEGVFNHTVNSISNGNPTFITASGCAFTANNNGKYMRRDLAYIPGTDHWGNSTIGYMTQNSDYVSTGPNKSGPGAKTVALRMDVPQAVVDASFNAADAQAKTIRNDTSLNAVIYTIGLGGANDAPTESVFQTFLTRISNDASSPTYDPTRPAGLFVYSPNSTQLNAAFQRIASQVLSISQ